MKIKKKEILYFCFFIIVSLYFIFVMTETGKLVVQNDGVFHLQRLQQVFNNVKRGHFFTFISTDTFRHIGLGSFLFYPYVCYYPFVFLKFFFQPVTAIYIGYGFFLFLTFVCSYYAMKVYSNSVDRSFIFSLIYTLCSKHIIEIARFQWGELFAYTFIPIALAGFYKLVYQNSYEDKTSYVLAIGLTLLLYTHLLSAYLVIMLITFIFLLSIKKVTAKTWIDLFKNVGVFLLLTFWILLPLFTDYFGRNVESVKGGFNYPDTFENLWFSSLKNEIYIDTSIGLVLVVTFIIGWVFIRENEKELKIFLLGYVLVLISTSLFPWHSLGKYSIFRALSVLQYSFRFLILAVPLLSVSSSYIIYKFIKRWPKKYQNIGMLVVAVVMLLFCSQLTNKFKSQQQSTIPTLIENVNDSNITASPLFVLTNKDYNAFVKYRAPIGGEDYILKNSKIQRMENNEGYLNGKKIKLTPISSANEITYNLMIKKNNSKLELPIVPYKHTKITLDGDNISFKISKEKGALLNEIHKGKKQIKVSYQPPILFYVFFFIAVVTSIVLFSRFVFIRIKKIE